MQSNRPVPRRSGRAIGAFDEVAHFMKVVHDRMRFADDFLIWSHEIRHDDYPDTSSMSGAGPVMGILHRQTIGRIDTDRSGGPQIRLGVRLATCHIVTRDDRIETLIDADMTQMASVRARLDEVAMARFSLRASR